jgi:hypothetical protein
MIDDLFLSPPDSLTKINGPFTRMQSKAQNEKADHNHMVPSRA